MIKWTREAIDAGIKGWFGLWASDEDRMHNALSSGLKTQCLTSNMLTALAWEDGNIVGFNDGLEAAIGVIEKHEDYSPYIVGKIKNDERRIALSKSIRKLKR